MLIIHPYLLSFDTVTALGTGGGYQGGETAALPCVELHDAVVYLNRIEQAVVDFGWLPVARTRSVHCLV